MKIVLAVDQYDIGNNGTTMSARNLVAAMRARGHEVVVLGMGKPGPDKFLLPELKIPIVTSITHGQGMAFAKPVEETIRAALKGADVVHFYMPFLPLAQKAKAIAEEMGVPVTGAFHVQPENITYNCGLARSKAAPEAIYRFFRKHYYDGYTHLHCPSNFIANELREHGYKAKLHVISNGVDPTFTYQKNEKPEEYRDKFCILMVGRLSTEKQQDVLIEAVRRSRHSKEIQLFFAGNGPKKKKYMRLGKKLPNEPVFGFYSKEDLKHLMSTMDLYVHSAEVEIEAISCIEAFSTGLVPLISNSPKSATRDFALDRRSLFLTGDPQNLADKIDYWIEHPEERRKMELQYSEQGKRYKIAHCAALMEQMFMEAIEEHKNGNISRIDTACCEAADPCDEARAG